MAKISQPPTPYPAVNVLLHRLLTEVQDVLGEQFVGLYLYGSLASGDFDSRASDIDFVVVTKDEIADDVIPKLQALHERIAASRLEWAPKLEGSYISRDALRRYNPSDRPRPQYNEGEFFVAPHGSDWIIQRHILHEYDSAVAGPPLKPWIDPVTPGELRGAVADILLGWWSQILAEPSQLLRKGYQPFAVLTMCRSEYAFEHGAIVSKPTAARWALAFMDARWRPLIERALELEEDTSPEALEATQDLIRATLEHARQWKNKS